MLNSTLTFDEQARLQPVAFLGIDIDEARNNISPNVWFGSQKADVPVSGPCIVVDDAYTLQTVRMENPNSTVLFPPDLSDMPDVELVPPPYSWSEYQDAGLLGAEYPLGIDIYTVEGFRDGSLQAPAGFAPTSERKQTTGTFNFHDRVRGKKSAPSF